jgi:LysR family glycine cleavage system transcriptional activator
MAQRPINRDIHLMGETVFPVCSPGVLDLTPGLGSDPRCLEKVQLLQEENTDSPELDWETWFPRIGADPRVRRSLVRCSGFSPVVAAAVAGGGVALGRSPLIDLELAAGRLVKLFGVSGMTGSWAFYIRTAKQVAGDSELRILIDYLTAEARTSLPP